MTSTTQPVVAYLGWHGRGNLGDDAIYDAVRTQLPAADFADMPILAGDIMRCATSGLSRTLRRGAQVIGGGTLLGRRHWRRLAARGLTLTRDRGSFAIGVGVEDPVFSGRRSGSGRAELARWVPMLTQFDIVSVRGPRSAELLADAGFDAAVAGDPALLLPTPDVAAEDGLIGINLGFGDDLWGHDPAAVAREISDAVRQLGARGHRFVGILMNDADRRWTETALAHVPADIVAPATATAAAAELARCSTVIVSRLHAAILAACSATPVISLEYQPKCRDFALSIDDERALLRTDSLTAAAVIDRLDATTADIPAIRTRTRAAVDDLRARLRPQYAALAHRLGAAAA